MKGKIIKSIEKYYYSTFSEDIDSETIEVRGKLLAITKYDENGNLILSKTFDAEDEIAEHIERRYNGKLLVEELIFVNDEVVEKHEFKYNSDNLIEKESIIYFDDTIEFWEYSYNQNNRLVEKRSQPNSDELIVHLFEYENDKIVAEKEIENEDVIIEKKYEYYENGNLIKFIFKDVSNDKEEKVIYEYDNQNNKIRELKYDFQDKLISRLSLKYDDNNRLIKKIEDTTYSSRTFLFYYNELGLLIKQNEVDENNELLSSVNFLYDGDVLIETKSEGVNSSDCFIIKNEIEYF